MAKGLLSRCLTLVVGSYSTLAVIYQAFFGLFKPKLRQMTPRALTNEMAGAKNQILASIAPFSDFALSEFQHAHLKSSVKAPNYCHEDFYASTSLQGSTHKLP